MSAVCVGKPDDAELGGVLTQLEPRNVLDALRAQLADVTPAVREGWRDIVTLDAAYHPGRYVRMAFALLSDPQTPPERVWPEADIVYLHAPVRSPMSRRGRVVFLGNEQVEAYRFPNDRRLRGLRTFASASLAPRIWQRWMDTSSPGDRLNAASLQRKLIRYVPEQRWIVRLRAEVSRRGSQEVVKRRIAVRCAATEACVRLARRHTELGRAFTHRSAFLRVPSLVGLDAKAGLLAVEWDRGDPLLTVLKQDESAINAFVRALRTFHDAQLEDAATLTANDVADSAAEAAEELGRACPDSADSLNVLREELCAGLREVPASPPVTLHNDLHLRQVHLQRGRFTFLDLERVASGDALLDVANLAVQLSILPHRRDWDIRPADAERWREAFLASWSKESGAEPDAQRFGLYAAACLLKLAHGAVRHLRPGWHDTVRVCVRLATGELGPSRVGAVRP